MAIIDGVKTWLFTVALKKATSNAVKVAAAWLMSSTILTIANQYGIKIDINQQVLEGAMTAFLTGGLEMVRNYLKQKFPKLAWL